MKILHIIASMNPELGGVCKAVRIIINSLEQEEVQNEVVCLDDTDSTFLRQDSFPTYALGPAKGPWSYSKKLVPWLHENIHSYEILVIHGLWLYTSYAVNKVIERAEGAGRNVLPKVYIMPHGMLDPYFQNTSGRKLKAIRNWIYWRLIESKVVNNADALLFTCEEERRLARKPFSPYHPKSELVLGLGVDSPPPFSQQMTDAFAEKCHLLNNRPYFLFLSRIHEKKGVINLLNAYLKLVEDFEANIVETGKTFSYPEIPALVIAGPGMESSYGRIVRETVDANSRLHNRIFFPGMLNGDAKWGAFYNCEAFVLPSKQENFGIAIVEALACAKPVLITNKVNIWREIETFSAGIVAEDTLSGTSHLLEDWCQLQPEEREEMSHNARKCYNTVYSTNSMSSRWEKITQQHTLPSQEDVSEIKSL